VANSLVKKDLFILNIIKYLINKSKIKISPWEKRNYKVVITIESLLHQSIVSKMFIVNVLLRLDIN
jgi:hypothetical protein